MVRRLFLAGLFGLLPSVVCATEPLPYLQMSNSAPVEIGGLVFVAAMQSQIAAASQGQVVPVEIQLWITNRTSGALAFRTFNTFGLLLKGPDGKEIPAYGGRNWTIFTPAVLLRAGETYCLCRRAEMNRQMLRPFSGANMGNSPSIPGRDQNATGRALFYWDGTGTETWFETRGNGRYQLSFLFESSKERSEEEARKIGRPVWSGKGRTKDISFEIIER